MEIDDGENEGNGYLINQDANDEDETIKPKTQSQPKEYVPVFVYVKVTEPEKSDSMTKYKILSQKLSDNRRGEVWRQYDDFQWLQHNIMTQCSLHGIVVPPLPTRNAVQTTTDITSTRGSRSNDDHELNECVDKDVQALERYLKLLIVHPVFGNTALLDEFLTERKPAPRSKVRKGFMDLIYQAVDNKVDYKLDPEEDFQNEFERDSELIDNYSDCDNDFTELVVAHQRLAVAYSHLASTLLQTMPFYTNSSSSLVHYLKVWSNLCDETKACIVDECSMDERTLVSNLEHYGKYMLNTKDMLNRRLKLYAELDDATRAVDKAKPHKKESAEEGKSIAEAAFNQCTEVARRELKDFHRTRLLVTQDALIRHAQSRLQQARHAHDLIDKSLNKLRTV